MVDYINWLMPIKTDIGFDTKRYEEEVKIYRRKFL